MAFFKFRWPGGAEPQADSNKGARRSRAAAQAEIVQLKGSIDALRQTLDAERTAAVQARARQESDHALERQALQQQIQALRERMEDMTREKA